MTSLRGLFAPPQLKPVVASHGKADPLVHTIHWADLSPPAFCCAGPKSAPTPACWLKQQSSTRPHCQGPYFTYFTSHEPCHVLSWTLPFFVASPSPAFMTCTQIPRGPTMYQRPNQATHSFRTSEVGNPLKHLSRGRCLHGTAGDIRNSTTSISLARHTSGINLR